MINMPSSMDNVIAIKLFEKAKSSRPDAWMTASDGAGPADGPMEQPSLETFIELYKSLRLIPFCSLAQFCLSSGLMQAGVTEYQAVIEHPDASSEEKRKASLALADLILVGYLSFSSETETSEIALQEIKKKTPEDLEKEILTTRALQAFEYVEPYKTHKDGRRLYAWIIANFCGKDFLDHSEIEGASDGQVWSSGVAEMFSKYYVEKPNYVAVANEQLIRRLRCVEVDNKQLILENLRLRKEMTKSQERPTEEQDRFRLFAAPKSNEGSASSVPELPSLTQ